MIPVLTGPVQCVVPNRGVAYGPTCSGLQSSSVGRALIGLDRLTLAGIIGCAWLTLGGLLATCDVSGLDPQKAP